MLPEESVPSLRLADAWSDQYDLGIATFLADAGARAAEAMMNALSRTKGPIAKKSLVENETRMGVQYERFLTRVLDSSELRATVSAVYAHFNPRDGDAFTLDVDIDDREGDSFTRRATLRASSNQSGPVLRVACEEKAPIFSARRLADLAVRAFDAPDDPIDRTAHEAAYAALDVMSLWYGELSLVLRNFDRAQSAIVSRIATTEAVWPPRSPRLEATRVALRSLERPVIDAGDKARDDARESLRAYAFALGEHSLFEGPTREMTFEEIDAARATTLLVRALTSSWNGRAEDEARALVDAFAVAPHQFFSLGNRMFHSAGSVSLFVVSADGGRVALIEYVGDGP